MKNRFHFGIILSLLLALTLLHQAHFFAPSVSQAAINNPRQAMPNLQGAPAIDYLKQNGLFERVRQEVEADRHQIRWHSQTGRAAAGWKALNPGQNIEASFSREGALITPVQSCNSATWQMALRLRGVGYGDRLSKVVSGPVRAKDNRIELQKLVSANEQQSAITEWYVNKPGGIEQGFTLAEKPGVGFGTEPLRLALSITGDLQPSVEDGGQAITLAYKSGRQALRYDHLVAYDALGRILSSRMEPADGEISLLVDDLDAVYPVTIDPVFTEVKKVTASDGATGDNFGWSVAISGDTAIVGAVLDDTQKGAAYLLERNKTGADQWGEVKKLTASDGIANDSFGVSVAISGDTAVVGAFGDDISKGGAYVFGRNQGGADFWGEVKKLTASDGIASDYFGYSVAISGDTAVVGAYRDDLDKGGAYIFERNQGGADSWGEVKKLTASDGAAGDVFGNSVAISGDTAIVGAYNDDSGKGGAYVFGRNQGGGDVWGEVKKLTASDGAAGDNFGYSVAISGDTAIVASYLDDSGKGGAYVYARNKTGADQWGEVKKLTASDGSSTDAFGYSVAISGDTAIVGAYGDDSAKGGAYVFGRNQGGADLWGEVKKLTASDGVSFDKFGASVAISGDTAIVGAYGDDAGKGGAYVFASDCNWAEKRKPVASDGVSGDRFGLSVAISGDTAIVGAYGDDTFRGGAYIFERNQGGADIWGEVKKLTASDGATNDSFGWSVAISGDTAVVGAYRDDGFKGGAYIFERNKTGADQWGEVKKLTASDGATDDRFGNSVAISGDTAIVGAQGDESARGAAYIFERNKTGPYQWGEVKKVTASDGVSSDQFGYSVAISGDTAIVGANGDDSGKGGAYVFGRNQGGADSWSEVKKLTASDGATGDSFGYSVAISGDTAIASAFQDDTFKGGAYIFERNKLGADQWGEVKKLTASDGVANDFFGVSVSISGDTAIVGAPLDDSQKGAAYIFERNEGGADLWGEVKKVTASDGVANDRFGSVAISGDTAVVGAFGDDVEKGAVFIFGCAPLSCPVMLTPESLPGGTVGTAYSQSVSGSPAGTYSYSVISGSLPLGLSLDTATGAITGTPTAPGSSFFTIRAAAGTCTAARNYTIAVACPSLSITTTSLPPAVAGANYSQQIVVSPAGSYTYSLVQGNLPSGMALNPATGLISGLPSVPGTSNFIVKAQLPNGCSVTQALSITVVCPTVTLNPTTLPGGQIGTPYTQSISASPSVIYTFSYFGTLPPGLALSVATGLLSGTPTANGTFNFTVIATGSHGCSGSRSYTVQIAPGSCPTITLPALPGGKVGTLYMKYVTAAPAGSYAYSLTGTLPPGLTFYSAIGLVYGYPTAAGNYTFSITATNLNSCTGTTAYSVSIAP